ncbi:MAG: hypothetical protein AB1762_00340 [Gemmatimonadota bacterium]
MSWRSLTIASLVLAGTLESQLLRPMTRDELWKKGLEASRVATSPRCAQNDWVYVETLLYFFAWYQNARPTNSEEARKFERDFNNKAQWTASCLRISDYSSSQFRDDGTSQRVAPPPPDTASFFSAPPQADVPPQTDALGRTIPQLLQLLANHEATIAARDATIAERDQTIASLQQNYATLARTSADMRAARAAGKVEKGYMCTIRSKASGLWWASIPGQGVHTRRVDQSSTFALVPAEDGDSRGIMAVQTQTLLIARENSQQVMGITQQSYTEADDDFLKFDFFPESAEGGYRIYHVKTNRWLTDAGGVISLTPHTERQFMPMDPNGIFLLNC